MKAPQSRLLISEAGSRTTDHHRNPNMKALEDRDFVGYQHFRFLQGSLQDFNWLKGFRMQTPDSKAAYKTTKSPWGTAYIQESSPRAKLLV